MNRLVRGRLDGINWIDQEVIWRAPIEDYFLPGMLVLAVVSHLIIGAMYTFQLV